MRLKTKVVKEKSSHTTMRWDRIEAPEGCCFYYVDWDEFLPKGHEKHRKFQDTYVVAVIEQRLGYYANHIDWALKHKLTLCGGSFYGAEKQHFKKNYKVIKETDKHPIAKIKRWVRQIEDEILLEKI